jgi:hypothetical protein
MGRSRLIIGVMGGNEQKDVARSLGAAIRSRGHIVLTGGRNHDTDAVKDATLFGAAQSSSSEEVARLLGILPDGTPAWKPCLAARERSFFLQTGLSSAERDCITGTTPDVLIILRGSTGTLTETAFAELVGRPLLFLASKNHLWRKCREHGGKTGDGELGAFLKDASAVYGELTGRRFPIADLESAVDRSFADREEFPETSVQATVDAAVKLASAGAAGSETSFPGLPHNPQLTRQMFNEVVRRIEQ